MNAFIQTIIKFFLRLFQGKKHKPSGSAGKPVSGAGGGSKPISTGSVSGSKPTNTGGSADDSKPVPEPPPPVDTPEPSPSGPLAPDAGLTYEETFEEDGQGKRKLKSIRITDGQVSASFSRNYNNKRGWEGWYTGGQRPIGDFIRAESDLLKDLKMTGSSQNLLQAVSENEGKLEAINAYDGAFLSFGIFQWTLGTGDRVGELPALMKKIKATYPDTFLQYFGRYGLDVDEKTNSQTGYLRLNDALINTRALKEQFRSRDWVYRFWRAGGDPKVQAMEVEHALSRLKTFYWNYKAHGFTLNKIITSEYGVALLLDNHVNLPGLVRRALEAAMNETGLKDPGVWGTEEERKVLEAYIRHRATRVNGVGPMYDAINRAKRTANYLKDEVISDERGSFQYSHTRSRGEPLNYVPEPRGYDPADFPDLEPDLEGRDMEFGSTGPANQA